MSRPGGDGHPHPRRDPHGRAATRSATLCRPRRSQGGADHECRPRRAGPALARHARSPRLERAPRPGRSPAQGLRRAGAVVPGRRSAVPSAPDAQPDEPADTRIDLHRTRAGARGGHLPLTRPRRAADHPDRPRRLREDPARDRGRERRRRRLSGRRLLDRPGEPPGPASSWSRRSPRRSGRENRSSITSAARASLLVLDNFEQVIDAAPDVAALFDAPAATSACSSRAGRSCGSRARWSTPCRRSRTPRPRSSSAPARACHVTRSIADLCRHLDDLPLAVELAAARTTVLSPKEIRERLGQRLDLFKGGRDADPRQRTLRATIDWSYDLLRPSEQQLFARLCRLRGRFAPSMQPRRSSTPTSTGCSRSSTRVSSGGPGGASGCSKRSRTIGHGALLRVRADVSEIARRHADYFLALAEARRAWPEGCRPVGMACAPRGRPRQPPRRPRMVLRAR